MIVTEMLLLLRTLVLWHDNRKLKVVLIVIYVVSLVIIIACYGVIYATGVGSICNLRLPNHHSENGYQVISGPYWAVALFEFAVIWMTIYHGYHSRASFDGYSGGRLTNALRKGNLVYACPLFATSSANIALYFFPPSDGWSGLVFVFQCVLHGALGSRITFELRDAYGRNGSGATTSDIQFARIRRQELVFESQAWSSVAP
ncbi:hypothetical protein BV22DRAFT_1033358 [Leucogyrophana mollusca]|uniref:Uncharacterized protein n=1 Tax=Leucogyrophana mollusca TaxID=85980 RepID=A0ACB8BL89_9AGAM|nr:hypothetical protein BV22DRAFT_1033358 [Leucogyrophana mollusca]